MKKQIVLESLNLLVSIGIHDFELKSPQPYQIDLRLELEDSYWTQTDALSETVDYDALRNGVIAHLSGRHFNLQETVIQDLLDLCFELDDRIMKVYVKTAKTLVYSDCKSVGLEYELAWWEWKNWKQARAQQMSLRSI